MRSLRFFKNCFYALIGKRTIGARILLFKGNKILLVKHSYQPGWYTIGGGVDRGESPLEAIHRELKEEVGVVLKEPPKLFAVYYSNNEWRDDYVVLYVGNDGEQEDVYSKEILDKQWFDLDHLPEDTTPGTHRRINEYLGKKEISDRW